MSQNPHTHGTRQWAIRHRELVPEDCLPEKPCADCELAQRVEEEATAVEGEVLDIILAPATKDPDGGGRL